MITRPRLRASTAALLGLAAACAGGARQPAGAAVERGVPLATLVVENRTGQALDIWFRYTSKPGGEVRVGHVAAGATARMAPVPAGEPIVLVARADGFERELSPRTFAADERWRWVIRTDDEPDDA